jgi:chemotaxis protein CheC
MTGRNDAMLEEAFHRGAEDGSAALAKWLGRPVTLSVDRLETLPIASAAGVLGSGDEPVCGCAMGISGAVGGLLLLAAEDLAALSLADTLLEQPVGSSTAWGELERSAVIETANIVGCAYLNALCAILAPENADGILPSPPVFLRDFPAAVMEAALMEQPALGDSVLLANTEFRISGTLFHCRLIFVPDAAGLQAYADEPADPEPRP